MADLSTMLLALTDLGGYQSTKGLSASQLLLVADVNGDGLVNNADVQAMLNNLLSGGGSVDPVPEPGAAVLFWLGALAFVTLKQRS